MLHRHTRLPSVTTTTTTTAYAPFTLSIILLPSAYVSSSAATTL